MWRFAWIFLLRDARTAETRLVVIALLIAVASVTSIGVLNQQVEQAMGRQEKQLLGADLLLKSDAPLPQAWVDWARNAQVQIEQTLEFATVIVAKVQFRLVDIKAVGTQYPLRGAVTITQRRGQTGRKQQQGPQPGTVWIEPRLVDLLQIGVGDIIHIGVAPLTVAGILQEEPGRATYLVAFAPRVVMHRDDIAQTQVVQPGSRITYYYMINGRVDDLRRYTRWLQPRLSAAQRLIHRANTSPALQSTIAKAESYLALSSVLSVLLAALAVAIAANRYSEKRANTVALLSCLGVRPQRILRIFIVQLLLLALLSSVMGCTVGYALAYAMAWWLSDWMSHMVIAPDWQPLMAGVATACATLFGFALSTLSQLKSVPPTQLLRRSDLPAVRRWPSYVATVVVVSLLMWWLSGDWRSTLIVIGACLSLLLCAALVVFAALRLGAKVLRQVRGPLQQTVRQVTGRMTVSVVQIIAIGVAMMVMLAVLLIRTDLLQDWQANIPVDAHNHFLLNIQPEQVSAIEQFFRQHAVVFSPLMPMVRGRLTAKNGVPIKQAVGPVGKTHNALKRALNLSWSARLPENNRIRQGRWWEETQPGVSISVEAGMAQQLGFSVGDRLQFQVADETIEAHIVNIRQVRWDSFKPNFYVLFEPGVLQQFEANYLTSFYLDSAQKSILSDLVQDFPTLSLIEIDALLQAAGNILAQVTLAVEYLALFVLAASLCVLYAALQSTLDERRLNAAIMRALGAGQTYIRRMLYTEWVVLGLVAGLLAAGGAELCAWILYHQVFHLPTQWHVWLWLLGPSVGVGLVCAMSARMARQVLCEPPLAILQKG